MEIMDEPTVIPFSVLLNGLNTILLRTPNPILQEILAKYPCFQEKTDHRFGSNSKWNHGTHFSKKTPHSSSMKERPKIGNKDTSKEAILKKDIQSLLNKLTHQNYEIILKQIKGHFHVDHMELFMSILWNAIQLQPDFQELYIHMLQQIYHSVQDEWVILLNAQWNTIWCHYIEQHQWKLPYDLVERSHNYNDFCDYVKEKKRLISISQAWARLINLGMIQTEPFHLISEILQHIHRDLQIENPVHRMCIECYIEQCKEYYKTLRIHLQKKIPDQVYRHILDIKQFDLPKSCYFKVVDFIELIEKNETPTIRKNNSIYELEDDGL
jgi:hypothetical protein